MPPDTKSFATIKPAAQTIQQSAFQINFNTPTPPPPPPPSSSSLVILPVSAFGTSGILNNPVATKNFTLTTTSVAKVTTATPQNIVVPKVAQKNNLPTYNVQKDAVKIEVPKEEKKSDERIIKIAASEEINNFNKDLCELLTRCKNIKLNVGNDEEKTYLVEAADGLLSFYTELQETTDVQMTEVRQLKQALIQSFAWYEDAKSRHARFTNPSFTSLCVSHELDPVSGKQLSDINHLIYYISSQLKFLDDHLDNQWAEFQDSCKKQVGKISLPTMEPIYQSMVRLNAILARQKYILKDINNKMKSGKKKAAAFSNIMNVKNMKTDLSVQLRKLKIEHTDFYMLKYQKIVADQKKFTKKKEEKLSNYFDNHNVLRIAPKKPKFLSNSKLNEVELRASKIGLSDTQTSKVEVETNMSSSNIFTFSLTSAVKNEEKKLANKHSLSRTVAQPIFGSGLTNMVPVTVTVAQSLMKTSVAQPIFGSGPMFSSGSTNTVPVAVSQSILSSAFTNTVSSVAQPIFGSGSTNTVPSVASPMFGSGSTNTVSSTVTQSSIFGSGTTGIVTTAAVQPIFSSRSKNTVPVSSPLITNALKQNTSVSQQFSPVAATKPTFSSLQSPTTTGLMLPKTEKKIPVDKINTEEPEKVTLNFKANTAKIVMSEPITTKPSLTFTFGSSTELKPATTKPAVSFGSEKTAFSASNVFPQFTKPSETSTTAVPKLFNTSAVTSVASKPSLDKNLNTETVTQPTQKQELSPATSTIFGQKQPSTISSSSFTGGLFNQLKSVSTALNQPTTIVTATSTIFGGVVTPVVKETVVIKTEASTTVTSTAPVIKAAITVTSAVTSPVVTSPVVTSPSVTAVVTSATATAVVISPVTTSNTVASSFSFLQSSNLSSSGSIFGGTQTATGSLFGGKASPAFKTPTTSAESVFKTPTTLNESPFGTKEITKTTNETFGFGTTTNSDPNKFNLGNLTVTALNPKTVTETTFSFAIPTTTQTNIFGGNNSNIFGQTKNFIGQSGSSFPQSSGSLFGSTTNIFTKPTTSNVGFGDGTSIFSNTTNPNSTFGQNFSFTNTKSTTGSLFGSSFDSTPVTSESVFGQTFDSPTASTGSFSFTNPTFSSPTGNIFGAKPTFGQTPTFGQSNIFGNTTAFGSSTTSGFGGPTTPQQSGSFGGGFGSPSSFGTSPAFGQGTFGSPPTFGSAPAFGSPPKVFGSPTTPGKFIFTFLYFCSVAFTACPKMLKLTCQKKR